MFDVSELDLVLASPNRVLTTRVNPGSGLTNGFYVGTPEPLSKIMSRFSGYDRFFPCWDYEQIVLRAFVFHKVEHGFSKMMFFKVRNNGAVDRQGVMDAMLFDEEYRKANEHISSQLKSSRPAQSDRFVTTYLSVRCLAWLSLFTTLIGHLIYMCTR
jgi:hypothetical protein